MQEYIEVRKAAVWSAFHHGEIDDDEATRELLVVERAARLGEVQEARSGTGQQWDDSPPRAEQPMGRSTTD